MKRIIATVFIIIMLTSAGCTSQRGTREEVFNLSNTSWGKMLETENGYYMSVAENMAYKLYYADKTDLSNWVPVCNKPDCAHEVNWYYGSSCNAYIGNTSGHVLEIIDDKIYCYNEENIMRMDLNGENHEEVRDLSFEGYGLWNTVVFRYDGKTFFTRYSNSRKAGQIGDADENSEWKTGLVILDPQSEEKDIVLVGETMTGFYYDIRPMTRYTMNSQELYLAVYLHKHTQERLGLEKVYQFEEENNTLVEVDKDRAYDTLLGTVEGKAYYLVEGQGILCDGEVVIEDNRELLQGGMFQEKYLYISDGWCEEKKDGMAIYDLQGNLICKIFEEQAQEYGLAEVLGYSDEHIFFSTSHNGPAENEGMHQVYAIDAQALAKGELKNTLCYEK